MISPLILCLHLDCITIPGSHPTRQISLLKEGASQLKDIIVQNYRFQYIGEYW